jgi:septum formation protein
MITLASKSKARQEMLQKVGLKARLEPSLVDERVLEQQWAHETPAFVACELGKAKALEVSNRLEGVIIGADQTLDLKGTRFTKSKTKEEMRENLLKLKGKTHYLHSSVSAARKGELLFTHTQSANLTMRDFSDQFLDTYIANHFDEVKGSVGCYHYEAFGLQFFDKIEGDYYTILGMPLLPLLTFLRSIKAIDQ